MWGWAIIGFCLAFVTFGISWLVFPFYANGLHAGSLLKQGYLNEKQWKEKERARPLLPVIRRALSIIVAALFT